MARPRGRLLVRAGGHLPISNCERTCLGRQTPTLFHRHLDSSHAGRRSHHTTRPSRAGQPIPHHVPRASGCPDTDHSLKAGPRGPSLLEDFHLREKITHFDHERIPERVVHARGAAAHGTFVAYGTAASVTRAGFLAEKGRETPVFVRFSTVLGSRGSADTVRDVRGFAVKFYTAEGNMDLVGNNMPVFFIQDGIKFPDIIHAGKPHPDREIPQAQTAHDTFWDFVSLHTEATHHVIWAMSDRGIPRSYRTMQGFGVHTFRLVAGGRDDLTGEVPLEPGGRHPLAGLGGGPAGGRRPTRTSIAGTWPTPSTTVPSRSTSSASRSCRTPRTRPSKASTCSTRRRSCPRSSPRCSRSACSRSTATRPTTSPRPSRSPSTPANLVPGIEVTDDPLMQARLFSYLDTQLTRLGGPNFTQLPINCPHAAVNDMLRDGMHQMAIHDRYRPVPAEQPGRRRTRSGRRGRGRLRADRPTGVRTGGPGKSGVLLRPLLPGQDVLAEHDADRATCTSSRPTPSSSARFSSRRSRSAPSACWPNIDAELCAKVAEGLGLPAPKGTPASGCRTVTCFVADVTSARPDRRPGGRGRGRRRRRPAVGDQAAPRSGRRGCGAAVDRRHTAVRSEAAGVSRSSTGRSPTTRSVEFDAGWWPTESAGCATSSSPCSCRRCSGIARRSARGARVRRCSRTPACPPTRRVCSSPTRLISSSVDC